MSSPSVENKVVVKIFGEEYPITGSDDPAYISKIADFLDSRMQDVARRSRTRAREKVAILTALSLASEILDNAESVRESAATRKTNLDEVLARLDRALGDDQPTP
ncbi:MAG: cell division protein ZapA [bacterium]|nr:cell division protein ZapA [bacterium]